MARWRCQLHFLITSSHLEASWAHLGDILRYLGVILGSSWAILGPSWAILGAIWGFKIVILLGTSFKIVILSGIFNKNGKMAMSASLLNHVFPS